jgi:hypothetical protein
VKKENEKQEQKNKTNATENEIKRERNIERKE